MPDTPEIARLIEIRFGESAVPVTIAIGGPGGTGKSYFSEILAGLLPGSAVLTLDDYKEPRKVREKRGVYGPAPRANRMDLILEHLAQIKQGQAFEQPVYRSEVGDADGVKPYKPGRLNLLDGEVSTYPAFREFVDFAIYIDSDWKTQLMSRVVRDVEERGHTPEKVLTTFLNSNLREFPEYGEPTRSHADLLVHCDEEYRFRIHEKSPR